ncbi:MAG: hypothetical protein F6K22_04940 [Okeania sp. SIO2F4]|uniref:hypothetical protein n=1 Tax=Okeania sp. SIO2F4 TaxID=2607790 RepID=UPI00142C3449|nr:hypothetical protein [Okeania sp. SIO2F4]NES02237.1 hypothetical protein [Okeania sp. SIO2F4]
MLNQSSSQSSPQILAETLRKTKKILQEMLDYLTQDLDQTRNLQLLSVDPSLIPEDTIDLQLKQHPQQIEEFFAPINQYLQEDFTILKQQRQALREEIRKLEQQRQENYALAQQYAKQEQIISEFSQALLGPVKETLMEHLSQLATQHLSPSQSPLESSKNLYPQTVKDIETSAVMKISEDKVEEFSNFENSFVDDSNSNYSEQKKLTEEDYVEANLANENIQMKKLSPEIDELNDPINKVVLPYPGYEFVKRLEPESKTTETEKKNIQLDKSNNQEYSLENKSSIDEKLDLETVKSNKQENENLAQLAPPSFEDNYQERQNYQNQTVSIKDGGLLTPELKLDASENRENLDNTEILESLSNLFGKLEVNEVETKRLIAPREAQEIQKNINNFTDESEEETYIQAPITESLLPLEKPDEKPEELLLSSNTLEYLCSDLESLEEIDVDELIDDPGHTQLQLGKDQGVDSTENTHDSIDNSLVTGSEEKVTKLEDLFVNIDDISHESTVSNQENIYTSAEDTDNELILEDILDGLTPETDEEIIETDNQEFLALETLLEDSQNLEKKN